jgi:hypothetical protein
MYRFAEVSIIQDLERLILVLIYLGRRPLEPHGVNVVGGRTTGWVWLPVGSLWVEVCFNIHDGKQN